MTHPLFSALQASGHHILTQPGRTSLVKNGASVCKFRGLASALPTKKTQSQNMSERLGNYEGNYETL